MYAIFTCYNDVITDKLKSHRKYDENLQFIQSLLVQERSTDQVTSYAFLQNFNPWGRGRTVWGRALYITIEPWSEKDKTTIELNTTNNIGSRIKILQKSIACNLISWSFLY
jgi:hypothetical protein